MPILEHTLEELKYDLHACAFNYWYAGWEYRVKSEGYEAVAKDCNASADEMLRQFEEAIRKDEREKCTTV